MEPLVKNFKKHLECSICLDTYNEPKTISCLHTFCSQCLDNHARASHRQGKFRCPECQAQIDCLKEIVSTVYQPASSIHNSLLSLLAVRQSGDGSSMTCGNCKKKSCDVHYCFDCARFMCPDCLSAHEVMRAAFEGHKVMPVTEFQTAGRLRSLVEATTLLFRTIPRARDHKIFLSFLSILCLSRLYTHRPPKP